MIRLDATIPIFAMCMVTSCVLRTPSLTARTPSLTAGAPSLVAGAPSAPPGPEAAPVDDHQVIEAGCTFTGAQIKGEPGSLHALACPAGCDKAAVVYGTDDYSADSPVCAAAMHAGAVSERGGMVTVMIEPGRPAYRGTKRNGVQTRDWGAYRGSYRFQGVVVVAAPPEAPAAPVIIEAGCTFRGSELHGDAGSAHRVSCPAGCTEGNPMVWGSDPYTSDSPVCAAAIHAGLIAERGGEVTVIVDDGKPAYRGSKRNGVRSADHGAYRASFRLRR